MLLTSQESVFHQRTVLSSPALDRYFPTGSQAIPLTHPLCADKVRIGLEMMDWIEEGSTFHIRIVLSMLQEASIRSSGDHATSWTSALTYKVSFLQRRIKSFLLRYPSCGFSVQQNRPNSACWQLVWTQKPRKMRFQASFCTVITIDRQSLKPNSAHVLPSERNLRPADDR